MRSRDTSAEARRVQQALLRDLGPVRRLEMSFEMSEAARRIAAEGIRARDPAISESEAHRLELRRILGDELFSEVWGRGGTD